MSKWYYPEDEPQQVEQQPPKLPGLRVFLSKKFIYPEVGYYYHKPGLKPVVGVAETLRDNPRLMMWIAMRVLGEGPGCILFEEIAPGVLKTKPLKKDWE